MKSTGLFGKNSGRVGGVVYSNYRGVQVVRSYQPQVKNPNSTGQVAQRAKFKLVSQVASSLSEELSVSFKPQISTLSSRNEWVKKIFPKVNYSDGEASLPIEDIMLTNSSSPVISLNVTQTTVTILVPKAYWDVTSARARFVFVGYNEGGELNIIRTLDVVPDGNQQINDILSFSTSFEGISTSFGNVRVIGYIYEPDVDGAVNYEDYEINGEDATLRDIVRIYSLPNVRFSESLNMPVPRGV